MTARVSVSRAQRRLPSRTGALPVIVTLSLLFATTLFFSLSPTLNPADLFEGRFLEVPVPKVTGLTQDRALIELERGRLRGDVHFVYSSSVPLGVVVSQDPGSSTTRRRDSAINIAVSRGVQYIALPDLVGKKRADVIATLRHLGLGVTEERRTDEGAASSTVIAQTPVPGIVVEGGSKVRIVVSTGPATRTVPEITTLPLEGAAFDLGKAGFKLGSITLADNPTVRVGSIVAADPPVGTVLPRDTAVNLVVSSGPPPVPLPKLTGMKQTEAVAELTKLGVILGEVTQTGPVGDPLDGVVMAQSPDPGTQVRSGDVVAVTVRRAAVPPPTLPPTTLPPVTSPPTTVPPATAAPAPGGG